MGAPASNEYFVSIDRTDFHRQEDYTKFNPQLCSHKTKRPAYRCDILVSTNSPAIVGINGPFIAGTNPDLKIFRETTKKKLSDGEKVLGDRGYRGDERIVTNYDDNITYDEKVRRNRLLAAHERINQQFKKWDCLSTTHFRHCTNMHANFVNAIAVIIQLEIEDSVAGS